MSKLWGGRFEEEADQRFARYNESFSFDHRLLIVDIQGSLAYARALERAGVLSLEESIQMQDGLQVLLERARTSADWIEKGQQEGIEDVHSFVEQALVLEIGDLAYKLHTGRSRNDQVATDLRLFLRAEIEQTQEYFRTLLRTLIQLAEQHINVVLPGYTHLQRAQPILFAHFLMAYAEMFLRDMERFQDTSRRTNRLSLGSGALAGNSHGIDRRQLAKDLGFADISYNSIDAVSDRDFVLDYLSAASIAMMHLSRLSEDLILYTSKEFGFIEMSDKVATGSSLMPQKKNPDALELIRGKIGR
ncbi:MAG: argininosuccinate lyase, partial [Myxococcota bacterium]